jgi:hypothetical protein
MFPPCLSLFVEVDTVFILFNNSLRLDQIFFVLIQIIFEDQLKVMILQNTNTEQNVSTNLSQHPLESELRYHARAFLVEKLDLSCFN